MQEIVYHTNYQLESNYWWFVARNKILLDIIKKYCHINKDQTLLDAGCGTGGFASFISKYINVICLDTSELALSYCQKRGLKNLFKGTLNEYPIESSQIDYITMLDVVEHIEDDIGALKRAYELLKNEGFLILTVPAYKWLWSQHDEIHMHKRRYRKNEMIKLLESTGFKVAFSSYFNFILFPIVATMRLTEKIFKTKKKNEKAVEEVPPYLNKILEKIFSFEKNLLKYIRFPFGLSILIIAKK